MRFFSILQITQQIMKIRGLVHFLIYRSLRAYYYYIISERIRVLVPMRGCLRPGHFVIPGIVKASITLGHVVIYSCVRDTGSS